MLINDKYVCFSTKNQTIYLTYTLYLKNQLCVISKP